MSLGIDNSDLSMFILIGDRILIKPKANSGKTTSGLYLPPNMKETEKIQCWYVIKTGLGYPIPSNFDSEENWKKIK